MVSPASAISAAIPEPSILNQRPAASMMCCRVACLCSLPYRTARSFTPGALVVLVPHLIQSMIII